MQIKARSVHDARLSSAPCILFHGATSCGGQHLAACCVMCRNRIESAVKNALPSTHARAGRKLCTQKNLCRLRTWWYISSSAPWSHQALPPQPHNTRYLVRTHRSGAGGPPHPPPQSIAVHYHVASPHGCAAVPCQCTEAIPQVHCPIQEALHRKANHTQGSHKSTTLAGIVVDATDNRRNNQREPKP